MWHAKEPSPLNSHVSIHVGQNSSSLAMVTSHSQVGRKTSNKQTKRRIGISPSEPLSQFQFAKSSVEEKSNLLKQKTMPMSKGRY